VCEEIIKKHTKGGGGRGVTGNNGGDEIVQNTLYTSVELSQ
jgi:hypothetical protein